MTPQHPQRSRGVYVVTLLSLALVAFLFLSPHLNAQSAGGFVVSDASAAARTPMSASQVQSFMPSRGRFTFPAPYSTEGVRLTNATDCGGNDCVFNVGYSYWRNINNSAGSDTMLILLTLDRNKGGTGPTLFSYNKVTGEVRNQGALFDANSSFGWATGEGWYFSATRPTTIYLNDGPRMLRYDVLAKTTSVVFDATTYFGANRYIWQMHSSNDDNVHSFTLRDGGNYASLGCAVYIESTKQFRFFAARGEFDECQIDKSGRYLLIKEDPDSQYGEDNVIEDLQAGTEQILYDRDGAGGHSDSGFGYEVAEDNWYSMPGAIRTWSFGAAPTDGSQGRLVFNAQSWDMGGGHIAHSNAQPGWTMSQQYACFSNASRVTTAFANEVSCFHLDGSLQSLVVAPVMTNLDAAGGGDEYMKLPKGNIDPTGEWFIWGTNMGGSRLDIMMVHVPTGNLPAPIDGSGSGTVTPPLSGGTTTPLPTGGTDGTGGTTTTPTDSATAVPVTWTSLVNVSLNNGQLAKVGGCDGCADAGAASMDQITAGDGYVEFTATETGALRYLGLSNGNPGTSATEIAFALRLQNGYAEVREKDQYRADTPFTTGDRLRVAVSNGRVTYSKNGTSFYTSGTTAAYPLLVDTSLDNVGSTLAAAVFSSGSTGGSTTTTPPPPSSTGAGKISWTNIVNADWSSGAIRKVGGCDGCGDAGAVSDEALASGDGYVEYTMGSSGYTAVALASTTRLADLKKLNYALVLNNGSAEVREKGVYRTDVQAQPGDLLRIAVVKGKVVYSKNGVVFWSSRGQMSYPMRAAITLFGLGSSVSDPTTSMP